MTINTSSTAAGEAGQAGDGCEAASLRVDLLVLLALQVVRADCRAEYLLVESLSPSSHSQPKTEALSLIHI